MGSSSKAAGTVKVFAGAAAGLALGVVSLAMQDSRPSVVGAPAIIALIGYIGYTEESKAFMYGQVDQEETQQFIKASLALALGCLYAWQVWCLYSTRLGLVARY